MRKGVNPEKLKDESNHQYKHRVIMPVYIPNVSEDYYKEALEVFKISLHSLITTINLDTTAITLINNNSIPEVSAIVNLYHEKIDKLISYSDNKGKVYAAISEMKSCYEPFVTCTDADVLFIQGWEKEVFSVFKEHPKAGVVAPLPSPSLGLKYNNSLFLNNCLFGNLKYNKIVEDEDLNLYLDGVTNTSLLNRAKGKYNWSEKQYYLTGNKPAIIGAGHFVATYKSILFEKKGAFPKMKFVKGYENDFIDVISDKFGLYRLSTVKTFAYHIGNKIDSNVEKLSNLKGDKILKIDFDGIKIAHVKTRIPYKLRVVLFKVLNKILKF
ncbi:glycosyltransferase [Dokdonia sp.]|uniref:glycosyltransferase n=1 Tax=Dokdonia sp. TaxID=2024995 RepID=UPI0032659003